MESSPILMKDTICLQKKFGYAASIWRKFPSYIWGFPSSNPAVPARTKNILLKMGAPQGLSLKNVLFSLAEQLKSSN